MTEEWGVEKGHERVCGVISRRHKRVGSTTLHTRFYCVRDIYEYIVNKKLRRDDTLFVGVRESPYLSLMCYEDTDPPVPR